MYSQSKYAYVRVDDLDFSDGGHNTANWKLSSHHLADRTIELRYPDSWFDNVDVPIEDGPLASDSSNIEDCKRGEGYITARRGGEGISKLDVQRGKGDEDIISRPQLDS
jgi:hypothetical protein